MVKVDPFPSSLLDQQFAILHFDHIFADRQAEAGSAVFPGDRGVRLFERLKNRAQPFFDDPDARVADR